MLAVLYDIHGNLPALEAVLADAGAAGADSFLLGGDYALFGAWPEETVARLRELDARWIRGNAERWSGSPAEAPEDELVQRAVTLARGRLGPAVVEDLRRLPESAVQAGVRFVHGSPVSDVRSFLPEPAEDEGELLDGVREPRLVFGHTHLQFTRRAAGGGHELLAETGWAWVHDRATALAARLAERLAERGLAVAPRGPSTLVSWRSAGAEEEVRRLAEAGYVVRQLPGRGLVRASVGAWSSEEELEGLAVLAGMPRR